MLHLAATVSALDSGHFGDEFFELVIQGTPAAPVDNSTRQLVIASVSAEPLLRRVADRQGGLGERHLGDRGNGDERGPAIRSKSAPSGAGGSLAPAGLSGH